MTRGALVAALVILSILVFSTRTFAQISIQPPMIGPPPEDFGIHPFAASPEDVNQGEGSEIASSDQRDLLRGILGLVRTQNGYHTPQEISEALGAHLVLTEKDSTDSTRWDADFPDAHIRLLEFGPTDKAFGQMSLLTVTWDSSIARPQCISPLKMFSGVQLAGGAGFQQVGGSRFFGFPKGEQASFSSQGLSEQTCVSYFSLRGRFTPGTPPTK